MKIEKDRRKRWYPSGIVFSVACLSGLLAMIIGSMAATTVGELHISILHVTRTPGGNADVQFSLRWVGENNSWVLNTSEPIHVVFYDGLGRIIGGSAIVTKIIDLDPRFCAGTVQEMSGVVSATLPPAAKRIALALGSSELESLPATIP